MKKPFKYLTLGAVAAAATIAGVIAYRNYQDSYEQLDDEETAAVVEDDFVAVEETDDGFDYIVEETVQLDLQE